MRKISMCSLVLFLFLTVPIFAENIYTKFNFIPGEKIIALEDLSATKIGDIPIGAFRLSGPAEVVLADNQRWLIVTDCSIDISIPKGVTDLTLEFYLKQNEPGDAFRLFLENEAQGYDSIIDVGSTDVSYQGHFKGEDLPFALASKDFYSSNQPVQIALTIQKQRTQLYVNKNLAMNTVGFNPVTPAKLRIGFLANIKFMIKDFALATEIPDIATELMNKGKYTSHGVRFDPGLAQVKEESYSVLKQVADVLQENPDLKLLIVGHTDNIGTVESNQKLSISRAESVKNYLVSQFKISGDRLQTAGKGDKEPIADNKTPDGRGKNRRVEFIRTK